MATVQTDTLSAAMVPMVGPAAVEYVPPLYAGDRLTRAEFERRVLAMPEVRRLN